MKICFFADSGSIHTIKWCNAFVSMGHKVSLISFNSSCDIRNVDFFHVDSGPINRQGGNWKVLLKFRQVKRILNVIKPDILHAHYATSYGIVGALTGFKPYAITAHGTDVMISPNQSKVYRYLLKFAFNKASWINLVSDHMSVAVNKIGPFDSKTDVIPFGIDRTVFNAHNRQVNTDVIQITSTRSFEAVYNLPHLIKAVAELKKNRKNICLNLIGDGTLRVELEQLVTNLGLTDITTFYGRVNQQKIVEVLKASQIYCSVSLSDGNSISLVEALACGCIPVVTNIAANHQWVANGRTGFLVEKNDVTELASTLKQVCDNYDSLAISMQSINENNVSKKADLKQNLVRIEKKYTEIIEAIK